MRQHRVGSSEVSMGLCCGRLTGVECAVGNNAWRESADGRARADSNAAGNLTRAAIGYGRHTQHGESLGWIRGIAPET